MGRFAIVTQSYRKDIKECELLCESIDKFVSHDIEHHIFVNDEDFGIFATNPNFKGHYLHKKGEIMPRFFVRFPWKILGHHYKISPITIPVREWIEQQICKLGIFEVLGKEIEAVMHVDSECVFLKPFDENSISLQDKSGAKLWPLYKRKWEDEPCHDQYCKVAKRLFSISSDIDIDSFCYMSLGSVFLRNNTEKLLDFLGRGSLFNNWKIRLGNIYRFSEFYLYGIFCEHKLGLANHFLVNKRYFPVVHSAGIIEKANILEAFNRFMNDDATLGICLQKGKRDITNIHALAFDEIARTFKSLWQ